MAQQTPAPQQQAQAGQPDPQHLQAAAQLGAEAQRAGLSAGTLFAVIGFLQKHGATIAQIAQEFGGLFGAQAPGGQAAPKK